MKTLYSDDPIFTTIFYDEDLELAYVILYRSDIGYEIQTSLGEAMGEEEWKCECIGDDVTDINENYQTNVNFVRHLLAWGDKHGTIIEERIWGNLSKPTKIERESLSDIVSYRAYHGF